MYWSIIHLAPCSQMKNTHAHARTHKCRARTNTHTVMHICKQSWTWRCTAGTCFSWEPPTFSQLRIHLSRWQKNPNKIGPSSHSVGCRHMKDTHVVSPMELRSHLYQIGLEMFRSEVFNTWGHQQQHRKMDGASSLEPEANKEIKTNKQIKKKTALKSFEQHGQPMLLQWD